MQVWNVLHADRWKIQDAKKSPKIAVSAPSHKFVGLYLRNEGTHRQSERNFLSRNTSSTCSHNMANFGPLTAEIGWPVWGTLQISTGFASWQHYCTASSSGHQPNFAALNRGRHLYSARRPSRWVLAHILLHFVSDIAIFVLKRDVKLQLTNYLLHYSWDCFTATTVLYYHLSWSWKYRGFSSRLDFYFKTKTIVHVLETKTKVSRLHPCHTDMTVFWNTDAEPSLKIPKNWYWLQIPTPTYHYFRYSSTYRWNQRH